MFPHNHFPDTYYPDTYYPDAVAEPITPVTPLFGQLAVKRHHRFPLPNNAVVVEIYSGNTRLPDYGGILLQATDLDYETICPGGLYGIASFFLPVSDVSRELPYRGGHRVVLRNGQRVVYEGAITARKPVFSKSGWAFECSGLWGRLGSLHWNHRFADNRLDETLWKIDASVGAVDKYEVDRNNRLRIFTKDGIRLSPLDYLRLRYTMPASETLSRAKLTYDFSETAIMPATRIRNTSLDDLVNLYDDDDSTTVVITILSSEFFYVGSNHIDGFDLIRMTFGGTVNTNASVLGVMYHNGTDWNNVSNLVDGTSLAGATFGQDGDITFDRPGDWDPETLISDRMFWLEFNFSGNLTPGVVIGEVRVGQRQAHELRLYDVAGAANVWSVVATGSAARDDTLGTPRQVLALDFLSHASQLGVGNGSLRGQISGVMLYATRPDGSSYSVGVPVTLDSIARDVRNHLSDYLNSEDSLIQSADSPLTLEPFVTEGYEPYTSILQRAASYGDAAYNPWNVYLEHSELAGTPNGLPVVVCEPFLPITDYDYVVSVSEMGAQAASSLVEDYESIRNWIIVKYTDELTSMELYLTPDDDATLKDDASIALYGRRELPLDLGTASAAAAASIGRRVLASRKDMQYSVSGPIHVVGYLRAKTGSVVTPIPACRVRAGRRLKIEDWITDVIFMVTLTRYHDADQSVDISCGNAPDSLSLYLAQREASLTRRI